MDAVERATMAPPALNKALAHAIRLEAVTVGWMVAEASIAIGAGITAQSVLLLAFGIDSLIELTSALLLFRRLWLQAHRPGTSEAVLAAAEERTAKISGYLLFALALYVMCQSGYGLLHRHTSESAPLGLFVAIIAALGMPFLAKAKIRAADVIGSRALRADAMESFTCAYLSWVLLAGLFANALLHIWWLDSMAALVLVPFLIKEGQEAVSGECACSSC